MGEEHLDTLTIWLPGARARRSRPRRLHPTTHEQTVHRTKSVGFEGSDSHRTRSERRRNPLTYPTPRPTPLRQHSSILRQSLFHPPPIALPSSADKSYFLSSKFPLPRILFKRTYRVTHLPKLKFELTNTISIAPRRQTKKVSEAVPRKAKIQGPKTDDTASPFDYYRRLSHYGYIPRGSPNAKLSVRP